MKPTTRLKTTYVIETTKARYLMTDPTDVFYGDDFIYFSKDLEPGRDEDTEGEEQEIRVGLAHLVAVEKIVKRVEVKEKKQELEGLQA